MFVKINPFWYHGDCRKERSFLFLCDFRDLSPHAHHCPRERLKTWRGLLTRVTHWCANYTCARPESSGVQLSHLIYSQIHANKQWFNPPQALFQVAGCCLFCYIIYKPNYYQEWISYSYQVSILFFEIGFYYIAMTILELSP